MRLAKADVTKKSETFGGFRVYALQFFSKRAGIIINVKTGGG